jgi:hypothetical protein
MKNNKPLVFNMAGKSYQTRLIGKEDKKYLQQGFSSLSEWSKYLRFFTVRSQLSEYELDRFTDVDGENHVAYGIAELHEANETPVGIGRFIRLKDNPAVAEVAITVVDSHQRNGLGHLLFAMLNIHAALISVKFFRYHVLKDNSSVIALLNQFGVSEVSSDGTVQILESKVLPKSHFVPEGQKNASKFKKAMKIAEDYISDTIHI